MNATLPVTLIISLLISNLGHPSYHVRERSSQDILTYSYIYNVRPQLINAAGSKSLEIARRTRQLHDKVVNLYLERYKTIQINKLGTIEYYTIIGIKAEFKSMQDAINELVRTGKIPSYVYYDDEGNLTDNNAWKLIDYKSRDMTVKEFIKDKRNLGADNLYILREIEQRIELNATTENFKRSHQTITNSPAKK
jgi:hypothetical protein